MIVFEKKLCFLSYHFQVFEPQGNMVQKIAIAKPRKFDPFVFAVTADF